MATKAQTFRREQENTSPKRAKAVKKVTRAARGSKNDRTSAKGDRKAMVALEDNVVGTPSRKSTRKSSNGQKGASVLEHVRAMKGAMPASRHGRRGG